MLRRVGLPTLAGLLAGILAAALARPTGAGAAGAAGSARISPERLLQHVRVLASDTFEGRSPASHGEDLTVAYLVRQFRAAGLEPGNPDGTYVQNVPLSAFRTQPLLQVRVGGGTLDNASGTAALLELAAAFRALPQPPARSLLFVATTAEERGLLGAAWYARHPLVPLSDTVAVLNIDGINPYGRTRDIEIVGHGKSELDELAAAAAASQGRRTQADAHPERGGFYRADQLEFARVGVPVLYLRAGREFVGQAVGYGEARTDAFIANDYHRVSDVIGPEWTMQGGAEDVQLLWQVGAELASSRPFPAWKSGSEFQRPPGGPRPAH